MTRFQRATLDPFDRCWMFPWRGSVHGPPTRLCRPLFKMAEVARVQGREVLSMIFFFFFFFFRNLSIFEFWRGFRWRWKYSKKDEFEDETIGELPSPGILEKFFLMEIRWFPFSFLILKFRENSKSHRVVEMLQDIWRLLSSENENGREMTMEVVAINGGFYLMESVFQEEYVLLARIPSSSKRSNKRSADRIPYDRWRHHVAEKEENEKNEGARDRRNIIILKTYKIRIECIKRS